MTTYTINHQKYYQNNKPEIMKKQTIYIQKRRKEEPLYKKYDTLIVNKSKTKKAIEIAIEVNNINRRDNLLDKLNNIDSQLLEVKKELKKNRERKSV